MIAELDKKTKKEILETNKNIVQTKFTNNKNTKLEVIKKCRYKNIDDNENIGIEVNNLEKNKESMEIPATSYILYVKDNMIHLLNLRYENQGLILNYKENPGRFELINK